MPRPSGRAQRIAERVVPGLRKQKRGNNPQKKKEEFMSKVESDQTYNMTHKKPLR